MSDKAARIREYYIEPPISLIETDWEIRQGRAAKLSAAFDIKTKIWVDQHLPEYRVAIAEDLSWRKKNLEHWVELLAFPIETRLLTYIPTGRVVYDNTKPHKEAIVFEYILEQMLGKKDLVHK